MKRITEQKKSAGWDRADIVAAIRKKGWSMRKLSKALGREAGYLSQALTRPYPKAEEIISEFLGVPVQEIWPERHAKRVINKSIPQVPPELKRFVNKSKVEELEAS